MKRATPNVVERSSASEPERPTAPRPAVRSTPVFRALGGLSARRIRGLSLLVCLLAVVALGGLAATGVVPWWAAAAAGAALLLDLAVLRAAARKQRAARRGAGRSVAAPARASRPTASRQRGSRRVATRSTLSRRPARQGTAREGRPSIQPAAGASMGTAARRPTGATAAAQAGSAAASVTAKLSAALNRAGRRSHGIPLPGAQSQRRVERPVSAEPDKASAVAEVATAERIGWQPVPVPPPTYTLKAKAERPGSQTAGDDLEDTQEMSVVDDRAELAGLAAYAERTDAVEAADQMDDELVGRRASGG